ncbi:Uncharacterised protein [Bordetella pertussis]|nr:Uncharacterised protein [Bordetella pertussis]
MPSPASSSNCGSACRPLRRWQRWRWWAATRTAPAAPACAAMSRNAWRPTGRNRRLP